MNKKATAIFLALLVAIMPFLGFPGEMKDIFYMVVGVLIAVLVQFSSVAYCSMCEGILERKHEEEDYGEEEEPPAGDSKEEVETGQETILDDAEMDDKDLSGGEKVAVADAEEGIEEAIEEVADQEDDLRGIFGEEEDKK